MSGCPDHRPCHLANCRYHMAHEWVIWALRAGRGEPEIIERILRDPSCALDLAKSGPLTLQEVGDLLGVSRERVRQIEAGAIERLRDRLAGQLTSQRTSQQRVEAELATGPHSVTELSIAARVERGYTRQIVIRLCRAGLASSRVRPHVGGQSGGRPAREYYLL